MLVDFTMTPLLSSLECYDMYTEGTGRGEENVPGQYR